MPMEELFDITEICEKFHISSRTLRFYEEKGLIESSRTSSSKHRSYNKEQIDKIRDILALRAIGLSVKTIQEFLHGDMSLKEMLHLRKAEIYASIHTKQQEIYLLEEALANIDRGEVFFQKTNYSVSQSDEKKLQLVRCCSEYIIQGNLEGLYRHFSQQIKDYMPPVAFQNRWRDETFAMGAFIKLGDAWKEPKVDTIFYQNLHFEKMIIRLKYVFRGEIIHGFWIQHVEK